MKLFKNIVLSLILILLSINSYAAATDGIIVNATGITQGGSNTTFTWANPTASKFKVWIKVPSDGTATNALYHVYPKGNSADNVSCSSTDVTNPCFEIAVNQAVNQNKWVQLKLNNDVKTAWAFTIKGFISINASNLNSSEFLSISSVSFESPLAIGVTYRGGIIFYLDATKKHGLIAAPKYITNSSDNPVYVTWYNNSYTNTGATGTAVGTGQANTTAIIASQGAGSYAAKLADDLVVGKYSDWYLPSKDELKLMYTNIGTPSISNGSAGGYYWSSSEIDNASVFGQYFNSVNIYDKKVALLVRAIRNF